MNTFFCNLSKKFRYLEIIVLIRMHNCYVFSPSRRYELICTKILGTGVAMY